MVSRLPLKQLGEICRRAAISHAAGLDARTIWSREAETGSPAKRRQFQKVSNAIDHGETLSDSLRQTGDYLPQLVYDMVHVGEQSGHVDESLNRLGSYYEHLRSLRTAFLVGIAWPVIQLVIAILVLGFVIWIMGFLQVEGMDLDMLGLGLAGSRGVLIYFSAVGVLFVAGFFFFRGLIQGRLSALVMAPLMKVPGLGKSLQVMAMSRMAWALGMSVESGMRADQCAKVALRSTQNKYFTRHQPTILQSIARGETLYEAFVKTEAFPQEFLDAVMVGEQTGRLGESMEKLSQQYEEQGKAAMRVLAIVGGVAVWMLVAAFIIYFIFQIALFYTGLLDNLINDF